MQQDRDLCQTLPSIHIAFEERKTRPDTRAKFDQRIRLKNGQRKDENHQNNEKSPKLTNIYFVHDFSYKKDYLLC
jgi:hypothetical protein